MLAVEMHQSSFVIIFISLFSEVRYAENDQN